MKTARINATAHYVHDLTAPLVRRSLGHDLIHVTVETDDGLVGHGFTSRSNRFAVKEYINRELGPALVGEDPRNTERLWHRLFWRFNQ